VRGRLGRAKPVRSGQLGGLTGGPGLSANLFIFDLIVLSLKPLRKNPNLFKNKPEKSQK
jgi:hypothetical protein